MTARLGNLCLASKKASDHAENFKDGLCQSPGLSQQAKKGKLLLQSCLLGMLVCMVSRLPATASNAYVTSDTLYFQGDDYPIITVDGTSIEACTSTPSCFTNAQSATFDPCFLNAGGTNTINITTPNTLGPQGFSFLLVVNYSDGTTQYVDSDPTAFTITGNSDGSPITPTIVTTANVSANNWYVINIAPFGVVPWVSLNNSGAPGDLNTSNYTETFSLPGEGCVTHTPTPVPTCGVPLLVNQENISTGTSNCTGMNGVASTFSIMSYTVPTVSYGLLMIRVELSGTQMAGLLNGSNQFPSVTFAGQTMTWLSSYPTVQGGMILTYSLVNPPVGANDVILNYENAENTCNQWNVVAETYSGVNPASPIGNLTTQQSTNTANNVTITVNLSTQGPASTLDDFVDINNTSPTILGVSQTAINYVSNGASNDQLYGDYKGVNGSGPQTLTYFLSYGRDWTSSVVEVKGFSSCLTPVGTSTMTPTTTPTLTATPTATPSRTFSATHTPTSSPTGSSTLTATRTASSTFTPTPTLSPTPTMTSSLTASPTATQTATSSDSPTQTATKTATSTATQSVTHTMTPSVTNTKTATPTMTQSVTHTMTPTATNTKTASPTVTQSVTWTDTLSVTETSTWTSTPTASPTPTPPNSPTQTRTATATPSQTMTFTVTSSPTSSRTWSASPTWSPSLTTTSTKTTTVTATPTPTSTLTFTSTPTPSVTLSLTSTRSSTLTVTGSETFTCTPSITVTFTKSPTPTITPTPLAAYYQLSLCAYNSAGELVKTIFNGNAETLPTSLGSSSQTVSTQAGGLKINVPGILIQNGSQLSGNLAWDLSNNAFQTVSSGIYVVVAQYTDSFGRVTTLSESVQVINSGAQNTLIIFNSAGEIVWQTVLNKSYPNGITNISVAASNGTYAPLFDANGHNTSGPLEIKGVDPHGNTSIIPWDGVNNQGQPVASGTYMIQMTYVNAQGSKTVVNQPITVIQSPSQSTLAGTILGPNPVLPGQSKLSVRYPASPGNQGVATIYTMSGELVAEGIDPGASGRIEVNIGKLAEGVYLVEVQKTEASQIRARILLKLAIVR